MLYIVAIDGYRRDGCTLWRSKGTVSLTGPMPTGMDRSATIRVDQTRINVIRKGRRKHTAPQRVTASSSISLYMW